ncbi:uncharacterized protein BJ212DRAFT_1295748 [Suillus subaureus]|uniref:Uncharacterized protein n=1 Tax=Suillus subaureus TaxID=48587 RepID=A0A9P7JIH3_9AGAM|nr:uncharacterized protein BJ212DRAFT_1295748 [Suillus subaureus]KAG1824621.1 hypothetical protein BJ212DRAFT_1295748 [Suillus subaureus]
MSIAYSLSMSIWTTIDIRHCDHVDNIRGVPLPSSKTLEFDGCTSKELTIQTSCKWIGGTVTAVNSDYICMKNVFIFLGVPLSRRTMLCSQWPHITMLKFVAKGDCHENPAQNAEGYDQQREENLIEDDEELDNMRFEGVRPIMYKIQVFDDVLARTLSLDSSETFVDFPASLEVLERRTDTVVRSKVPPVPLITIGFARPLPETAIAAVNIDIIRKTR